MISLHLHNELVHYHPNESSTRFSELKCSCSHLPEFSVQILMERKCAGVHVNADRSHYDTSHNGLQRAGLVFAKEGENPPFVWVDGILSKEDALDHLPYQRFNKIPGMDYICYKSTLFRALNEMRAQHPHLFDVYPRTFLLPKEFLEFQREHKAICGKDLVAPSWVIKPRNSCCGRGISILQSVADVRAIPYESVAQLYIHPFLLDGHKFDFRLYVLIASLDPLTIFIYKEGIARFCTEVYEPPSKANRDKKFMHLTNTAINIENSDEPPSAFTKLASGVLEEIEKRDKRGRFLWKKICEASRAVIIGIYGAILHNLPKKCDQRQQKQEVTLSTKRREREPLVHPAAVESPRPNEDHDVNGDSPAAALGIGVARNKRPQVELMKKPGNVVVVPNRSGHQPFLRVTKAFESTNPTVFGSVVSYQIQSLQSCSMAKAAQRWAERSKLPRLSPANSPEKSERVESEHVQALPPLDKPSLVNLGIEEQAKEEVENEEVVRDEVDDNGQFQREIEMERDECETQNENEDTKQEQSDEFEKEETEKKGTTEEQRGDEFEKEETEKENTKQEHERDEFEKEGAVKEERSDELQKEETEKQDQEKEETEKEGQETEETHEGEKEEQYKPLKITKRYFHILGIDIMIDSDLNPQVLELNDRPSLGVTVDFEQDLKESVISDAFEHVRPDGRVRDDSPETSRWVKIYPLPESEAQNSPWPDIVKRILNPNLPPKEPVKQPQVISKVRAKLDKKKKKRKKGKKATHTDEANIA